LVLKTGSHEPVPHIAPVSPRDRFEVVPLSLRVGEDFDVLVITGPNTGGKTVALKCVGLLTLMALSGVPIPAAPDSTIPAYRDVLADIGDEQSIEQSLSTFSAHMSRITAIMRDAGPDVLVLLDELGSGTDPVEGEALGRAILARLLERGVPGVVTTHLGALKTLAYEYRRAENACMEFDPKSLGPTYHLRLGLPGNSNALIIAERLGMERGVLEAAKRALERKDRRAEAVIADLQATRVEAERRRAASDEMLAEASRRRADVEEEAQQVRDRQDELKKYADREVERHLRHVRERLFPILNRLKNVPKPFDGEVQALNEALDDAFRVTPLGERREAFIARLKKDRRIDVPRLGVRGRVVRVDKKRRLIGILVGDVRMDVPFEDVLPEDE
jgi:DNA mismatch repair protein MutS2